MITGASQSIDGELVRNIPFEYAANMIAISLADLTARGAPDYLLTTPDFADDREAALKALVARAREETASTKQVSAETLAKCRVTIKALKDKVDSLLPQDAPNRLDSDNYLKALFGLSKMLETPSVGQYFAGTERRCQKTDLGHLISFMHTFNLRFGASKTPMQEADLRSALSATRRLARPGQGTQRQPLHDLQRSAKPQGVFGVLLTDAVRPETWCRASSAARAGAALIGQVGDHASAVIHRPGPRPRGDVKTEFTHS